MLERLDAFKTSGSGPNDNEAWESPARTSELVKRLRVEVLKWVDATVGHYKRLAQGGR